MISADDYDEKGKNLDAVIKSGTPYNLSNMQFDAPAGSYAIVADKLKGKAIGVSIRKIK